jgi:nucleotide-binding universal stress UspA family protein
MGPKILIATNGYSGSQPSIDYGTWLAELLDGTVTLLGVDEHPRPALRTDHSAVEDFCADAVKVLEAHKVENRLEIQTGDAEAVIPRKSHEADYITVVGPLGRSHLHRLFMGRSIRHLMAEISGPIIYVPQSRLPPKKLLICIGGLGYEMTAENLALQIGSAAHAEVVVLHVVPPLELDYPTARIMRSEWDHLVETNTPVGRSLRKALETAQGMGLNTRVVGRQGNIVEEILDEVRTGGYDLLCMGSPYSTNALRQLYASNVTADIAQSVEIPLITARYKKD